jgi:hypothetical protein
MTVEHQRNEDQDGHSFTIDAVSDLVVGIDGVMRSARDVRRRLWHDPDVAGVTYVLDDLLHLLDQAKVRLHTELRAPGHEVSRLH